MASVAYSTSRPFAAMKAGPRLELRQGQSQSLVMTQALQQSIKLLQCNALELKQFVEQELEKNPFLLEEGESEEAAEPGISTGEEISEDGSSYAEASED